MMTSKMDIWRRWKLNIVSSCELPAFETLPSKRHVEGTPSIPASAETLLHDVVQFSRLAFGHFPQAQASAQPDWKHVMRLESSGEIVLSPANGRPERAAWALRNYILNQGEGMCKKKQV